MEISYKDPNKLIDTIIKNMELTLSPEQHNQLKDSLEKILAARIIESLSDYDLTYEDSKDGLNKMIMSLYEQDQNIDKRLKFIMIAFYEEMVETPTIIQSYTNSQS